MSKEVDILSSTQVERTRSTTQKESPVREGRSRPSKEDVISAIQAETSCSYKLARRVYGLMGNAVGCIRSNGYTWPYHLSQREIDDLHEVLDAIMPDDFRIPRAGTAHDLIHRHWLRPENDELALVHTKAGPELVDCVIAIDIRTAHV